MKERIILNIYFILIFFLCGISVTLSQITNQWEMVNRNEKWKGSTSLYSSDEKTLSAINENDFIKCSTISYSYLDSIDGSTKWFKGKNIEHITNKGKDLYEIYKISDKTDMYSWNSVDYPGENVIVIVGDSNYNHMIGNRTVRLYFNLLILSRDGGKTWETTIGDSNQYFKDVSMYDSSFGLILHVFTGNEANRNPIPRDDSLWLTEDCWKTIKKIPLPNDSAYYSKVFCFSKEKYALLSRNNKTNQEYILFTHNGGKSWEKSENIGQNCDIRQVVFVGNSAYAIGYGYLVPELKYPVLYRSKDNGYSWQEVKNIYNRDFYSNSSYNCLDFFDELNGIVGIQDGRICRTSDGCETWSTEYTPDDNGKRNSLLQVYYPYKDFTIGTTGTEIVKSETNQCLAIPKFERIVDKTYRPTNNVTINWYEVEGAESYQIKIKKADYNGYDPDSTSFIKPMIDTILTMNSLILNKLFENMYYDGWIRAIGDNLTSNWSSQEYIFATFIDSLYCPDLIYPIPNSLNNPTNITVQWNKVPQANKYFINILYDYQTLWDFANDYTDTAITFTELLPNRVYYIQLSAASDSERTPYYTYMFVTGNTTDVNISKFTVDYYLKVYPNPSNLSNSFNINYNFQNTINIQIELVNNIGIKVADIFTGFKEAGEHTIQFSPDASFPSGVYWVRMILNGTEQVEKPVVIMQ